MTGTHVAGSTAVELLAAAEEFARGLAVGPNRAYSMVKQLGQAYPAGGIAGADTMLVDAAVGLFDPEDAVSFLKIRHRQHAVPRAEIQAGRGVRFPSVTTGVRVLRFKTRAYGSFFEASWASSSESTMSTCSTGTVSGSPSNIVP